MRPAYYYGFMFTGWPVKRTPPSYTGDERSILNSLLDFHRETALAKCEGLTDDQLRSQPVPGSPHSLIGLLRHLTYVELYWCQEVVAQRGSDEIGYPFGSADNDADFFEVHSHSGDEVFTIYSEAVKTGRESLARVDFDELRFSAAFNRELSIRFIHAHMLEEYARHCGHIDMLREALDGKIGY